jgi:hypothetical protein
MIPNEAALIDIDFVREIRQFDKNYNSNAFDAIVLEVQRKFLLPTIGYPLYKDLIDNPTESRNVDLLDGAEYTYNGKDKFYYGIKFYVAYKFLEIYAKEGKVKLQEKGRSELISDFTSNRDTRLSQDVWNQYKDSANENATDLLEFLDVNQDVYTLFQSSNTSTAQNEKVNFSVIGNEYNKPSPKCY